jgi:hypothetical protein
MMTAPASNGLDLMMLLRRSPGGTLIIYVGGAMIRGKHSGKRRLLRGLCCL